MLDSHHDSHKNFFELQRYYQRNSLVLYILYILAMLIHLLLAVVIFMIIWWVIFGSLSNFTWFWLGIIIPSYFILNALYHYNRVVSNDDILLKDFSVKRLFISETDYYASVNHERVIYADNIYNFAPKYRRYYEFAQQLAIACHIKLPKLYVMDDKSVNAFVAGINDNIMLVVSEGALQLDNESLYGLIGHEYGHILHGDTRLNLRMYVLMSSLSWLYDVADGLVFLARWRQQPKVNSYYATDELGRKREYIFVTGTGRLWIEFISLIIRLLGFLGMAMSEWIKQHFNRQREYLADATSMQLTRSDGIIRLLKQVERTPELTYSPRHYTTHLSYFFFISPMNDGRILNWRERVEHLGSTHPKNSERINALIIGQYEYFANIAIQDLNKERLQNVHDEMMGFNYHKEIDVIDYQQVQLNDLDTEIKQSIQPNNHQFISIPIYHETLEISDDKIINGRFVRDKIWDNSDDDIVYPQQAKMDYDLKDVKYINLSHIKNMYLPLIVKSFLRNDELNLELSGLFSLYYTIIFCHDVKLINLNNPVYITQLFGHKNFIHQPILLDKSLLRSVAGLDRRADNGLLLVIYHRMANDLQREHKRSLLLCNYQLLLDNIISLLNKDNDNTDNHECFNKILWQGVHLYRLLDLIYEEAKKSLNPLKYHDDLIKFFGDYHFNDNERIIIVLIVGMVNQSNHQDKKISTICRLVRLINHEHLIAQEWIVDMINMIGRFTAVDFAILLLNYDEKNSLTSKRYIDTLHTALLRNGVLCERDYETLLTLHDNWCPNADFMSI